MATAATHQLESANSDFPSYNPLVNTKENGICAQYPIQFHSLPSDPTRQTGSSKIGIGLYVKHATTYEYIQGPVYVDQSKYQ